MQKILDKIAQTDFSSHPEPETAPGEMLYMLSVEELNKARTNDEFLQLQSQIQSWLHSCATARTPDVKQWLKNLDMYEGRHFNRYDETSQRTVATPIPTGEVRIAMNTIQPTIRTEMAKTTSSHPTASVQPASNDDADILAARAGEAAWEWFYAEEKIQTRVMNQANFWRAITGNGFTKTFFDMHSEDVAATALKMREWRRDKEANKQAVDGLNAPLINTPRPTPSYGKVTAQAITPSHLYVPDLTEPDIQRQPYLLQTAYIPKERAKLIYADVMPADWEPSTAKISDSNDLVDLNRPTNPIESEMVQVTEAWIKPNVSRNLPEGGLVVLLDNQIVAMSKGGMPYEHGKFPYQHIYTVETGRFYRTSVIVPLIPLQNELNRIYAQLIKYKNLTTAPAFFYRQGSLDPTRIRPLPGTYIPVMLGMEYPQPVPLPAIPAYVMQLVDGIKSVMDDISGQHQVSRAISPGADTAASAISILREADDDYLSNTLDSIEVATEEMAQQALALMVQFWDEPRLVKVVGSSERVSARVLTSSDIAAGTDIRTTVGSGLPQSRSARMAVITEWMDKGYVPPNVGLKAIEAGALGKLFSLLQIDEDQAERENVEMDETTEEQFREWEGKVAAATAEAAPLEPMGMEGMPADPFGDMGGNPMAEPPAMGAEMAPVGPVDPMEALPAPIYYPINDFDNHAVHIDVIERRMKSQEWKGYPEWKQQIFLDHRSAHLDAAMQALPIQEMQNASMAATADEAGMMDASGGGAPAPEMASAV